MFELKLILYSGDYSLDQRSLLFKCEGIRSIFAAVSRGSFGQLWLIDHDSGFGFLRVDLAVDSGVISILLLLKSDLSINPLLLPFVDVSFTRNQRKDEEAKETSCQTD